jgi:RimJ/RimL family protein N-acetyltransferase
MTMEITPVVLEGRVVRLVPLTLDHIDALWAAGGDPSLWAFVPTRMTSRDEMRDYVEIALTEQSVGRALPFVTVLRETGTVIGSTRFAAIEPAHRRLEIGWTWITPAWQRSAVNTEAKFLMLRHAFETLGCRRVELKTSSKNLRSRAAMKRIGATEEGIFRQHMVNPDGSSRDTVYLSILDGEWPAVRERLVQMLDR